MRKLIVTAGAVLLLAACGAGAPDAGTVTDKRYTPSSVENECKGTGAKRKCKLDVDPEVCEFRLKDGEKDGWVEVPCASYESVKVNDWYQS